MFTRSPSLMAAGVFYTLLLGYACVTDLRSRRIPNQLVAVLLVAGLLFSASARGVGPGLLVGGAGMLVGFAIWFPAYVLRWLGAGDVKLFAAAGAWLGPMRAFEGSLIAALVGGVLALAWMVREYGSTGTMIKLSLATSAPGTLAQGGAGVTSRRTLPYGVALAAGAAAAAWLRLP